MVALREIADGYVTRTILTEVNAVEHAQFSILDDEEVAEVQVAPPAASDQE